MLNPPEFRRRSYLRAIQEFGGQRFWLCGKYFQRCRDGLILHRVVWERE